MAQIKIRGQTVNVDIQAELEEFEWVRPKWTSDKLIAASPFRYDRTPSFFVNLSGELAGVWSDSGAYDSDWASGGFPKLLSFLRNETYEETIEYLMSKYSEMSKDYDIRIILPKLSNGTSQKTLPCDIILIKISPYLLKRGISEVVQYEAKVGKTNHNGFVAIPWYNPSGKLANVKYRANRGKTFFYEKGAQPIRQLVYGADLYVRSYEDLIVCEAEIDALSWRTAGYNAVAVGGVAFTQQQADILRRLPFRRLIVAGDNDKAGARFNAQVIKAMTGRDLAVIEWRNSRFKDANDILLGEGIGGLVVAYEQAIDLPTISVSFRVSK